VSDRQQIVGSAAIVAALECGKALQRIVLRREADDTHLATLERHARAAGIPVQRVAPRHFQRLQQSRGSCDALALVGSPLEPSVDSVLAGEGATWQLVGVAYPGNAGMALRTAEVSGSAGAFIEADFDRAQRRAALRASMRVDRFMPVFFAAADGILDEAARAGRRLIAVEDVGDRAPWDVDLRGRIHLVVGGEAEGIPEAMLARCDAVVRLPMAGFLPSYNLQAAVAAVAAERLRQLETVSR
jgi:23S rRNA (guanosine2251-2'-O)-methyltransferase